MVRVWWLLLVCLIATQTRVQLVGNAAIQCGVECTPHDKIKPHLDATPPYKRAPRVFPAFCHFCGHVRVTVTHAETALAITFSIRAIVDFCVAVVLWVVRAAVLCACTRVHVHP